MIKMCPGKYVFRHRVPLEFLPSVKNSKIIVHVKETFARVTNLLTSSASSSLPMLIYATRTWETVRPIGLGANNNKDIKN